jgi:hypothetical protein
MRRRLGGRTRARTWDPLAGVGRFVAHTGEQQCPAWSRAGAPNHQQNPADLRQQGQ